MSKVKKLDNLGVSAFCESMGMMARAGIQTEEAISLLGQNHQTDGVLGRALKQMNASVAQGQKLADAMEETGIFPDYALQMLRAGESSGRHEEVLMRLSDYYRDQKTISEKLQAVITYPAAMLIMIIVVLIVMLFRVLPTFTSVYEKMSGSMSASGFNYISWSYHFCWVALIVMGILALGLLLGRRIWAGKGRKGLERFLCKFRASRGILESLGLFRFTSALETFLASGALQDEAVQQSIPMTDYQPLEKKLQACADRMAQGCGFAQAAYDEDLLEPIYGRMLLAGERSGDMESVLGRLTKLLEENAATQVDRLVGFIDPLLAGVLMVTVGLSLLSVMLPLIGIMSMIG